MSFSEKLTRIRHTRGFGVHSPFAYLLAKLVIKPARGYSYYGYRVIDCACSDTTPSSTRRAARMLLRLLTRLLQSPIPVSLISSQSSALISFQSSSASNRLRDGSVLPPESNSASLASSQSSSASNRLRDGSALPPESNPSIFLPSDAHPAFRAAVKGADSRFRIITKKKDAAKARIIAADANEFTKEEWQDLIKHPGRILLIANAGESLPSTLFSTMPEGVMIKGERNIIVIHRPQMQKLTYLMDI